MATNFPTSLDTLTNPTPTNTLNSPSHSDQHANANDAIEAIEAKIGIGASTPINNRVLRGTGTGTSSWSQLTLSTDITGTLPVANGGTGVTTSTGSTNVVLSNSPTLVTPTIASIVNSGTLTLPTSTDTLVGRATTDTLTNKTLTAPRFADLGFIADANGNELIILDTVTTAVNEITIANAATNGLPTISATGGDTEISAHYLGKASFNKHSGEFSIGNSGSSKAISWDDGDRQTVTLTASCTFTYTGATKGQCLILRIIEDGTGAWTVTLPTSKWPGGVAGTFTTTANAINLLTVYYDGTNYLTQLAAGFA